MSEPTISTVGSLSARWREMADLLERQGLLMTAESKRQDARELDEALAAQQAAITAIRQEMVTVLANEAPFWVSRRTVKRWLAALDALQGETK